jgi:2-amino-4-hydroxy-6-hydroxymethyldihydropteridine diphosphokinase
VALGSNVASTAGGPEATVRAAFERLEDVFQAPVRKSKIYATPAFPVGSGPDFANAAAALDTSLSTTEVLEVLHTLEAEFGRRRVERWAQRTLDLDLIARGQEVRPDREILRQWMDLPLDRQKVEAPAQLVLPHPRLQDRPFVLIPLRDVAPDWRHPITGRSVAEMCGGFSSDALAEIRAL